MFSPFWPSIPGPWRQPNKLFLAQVCLETMLSSAFVEPLIGFLAYLEPKLWLKNPIFDENKKVPRKV